MSNGNINVSWNKNTEVDLLGYNIFLNNEWVGTVDENATSYTIKNIGQVNPENLFVTIEAFDYDGETSNKRTRIKV